MSINIKNQEADRLVREIKEATGRGASEIILELLRAERARIAQNRKSLDEDERVRRALDATREIQRLWRESPVIDSRCPDEIVAYDENGLPI